MPDNLPTATHDLPPEKYPIVLEFLHPETGEVVHQIRVERPKSGTRDKIYIPPLSVQLGHPVALRITYGDGTVDEMAAPEHAEPARKEPAQ